MKKSNHKGKVLQDHKKVGKKFIPPIMQMEQMRETSFVEERLPCLIWISALYGRLHDKKATEIVVDFVETAHKSCNEDKVAPLQYLSSFASLSETNKASVRQAIKVKPYFDTLLTTIEHQFHLLNRYPLAFLFSDHQYGVDREDAIQMLKEDVNRLFDRTASHAVKVQVTAMYTQLVTGNMKISAHIDLPDFNVIFTAPESEDAKRVASFARANINGLAPVLQKELGIPCNDWPRLFWNDVFKLDGCEYEY
jgi:hypothetical protein